MADCVSAAVVSRAAFTTRRRRCHCGATAAARSLRPPRHRPASAQLPSVCSPLAAPRPSLSPPSFARRLSLADPVAAAAISHHALSRPHPALAASQRPPPSPPPAAGPRELRPALALSPTRLSLHDASPDFLPVTSPLIRFISQSSLATLFLGVPQTAPGCASSRSSVLLHSLSSHYVSMSSARRGLAYLCSALCTRLHSAPLPSQPCSGVTSKALCSRHPSLSASVCVVTAAAGRLL